VLDVLIDNDVSEEIVDWVLSYEEALQWMLNSGMTVYDRPLCRCIAKKSKLYWKFVARLTDDQLFGHSQSGSFVWIVVEKCSAEVLHDMMDRKRFTQLLTFDTVMAVMKRCSVVRQFVNRSDVLPLLKIRNGSGRTIFSRCVKTNNGYALRAILDSPHAAVLANYPNTSLTTPFISAAMHNMWHICEELLELGADPCVRTARGFTALAWATYKAHVDVVRELLKIPEVRQTMNQPDSDGKFPINEVFGNMNYAGFSERKIEVVGLFVACPEFNVAVAFPKLAEQADIIELWHWETLAYSTPGTRGLLPRGSNNVLKPSVTRSLLKDPRVLRLPKVELSYSKAAVLWNLESIRHDVYDQGLQHAYPWWTFIAKTRNQRTTLAVLYEHAEKKRSEDSKPGDNGFVTFSRHTYHSRDLLRLISRYL
jgi:hypothetical protein